ncbi:type IV secretion system protein [Vagococcus entomophilus]|uniref:Conjugal transfer protein TrbL n=1 Tax=Vagococcus entomophilus TaxID=1160095 RepID=A0A430AG86_9ENTE|nr:type IV secretion system protein [Vagococcus entomophilus]RSU06898.1 hypothetical protein CBF30_06460 [Vagococcus entomophilus]
MNDAVLDLYDEIMKYLRGDSVTQLLTQSLPDFIKAAYNMVVELQQHVIGPIGFSLLSVFILLEFQKISLKVEGAGGAPMLGFEMIMKAMVKFVLSYILLSNIQLVLNAIISLTNTMTAKVLSYPVENGDLANMRAKVASAASDLSWWTCLIVLLVFAMLFLVALVIQTYIRLVVYLRLMELYLYCALAPIPIGAAPSQEFSSMTKNFLKNFASSALQATVIALVLVIYPTIFEGLIDSMGSTIWTIILGMLIYMLALIFAIQKTGTWAKMVFQAQ